MEFFERKNGVLFAGNNSLRELSNKFGSPLYIYSESIIRQRCREAKSICDLPNFKVSFAVKANSAIGVLQIIRTEGIDADTVSPGEIYIAKAAGYENAKILLNGNNLSADKLKISIDFGIKACLDSISQISMYGQMKPGADIYIRVNPGKGEGHHEKVITAGKVKFGIEIDQIQEAFAVAQQYKMNITGILMHIGSMFSTWDTFHENVLKMLALAEQHPSIDYIDFGGGFGTSYFSGDNENFDFAKYSPIFTKALVEWMYKTNRKPMFAIQPGRYLVAQSGICVGKVTTIKQAQGLNFLGTDLGFNVMMRPVLYDSYHRIENADRESTDQTKFHVVGNICESGDIMGKDRDFPADTQLDDRVVIYDTGAYGYSMSSNYNSFTRPAEILIDESGNAHIIRKAESYDDLIRNQPK